MVVSAAVVSAASACASSSGTPDNGTTNPPSPLAATANCVGGKWQIGGSTMTCNPGLPPDAGTDAADSGDAGDGGDSG